MVSWRRTPQVVQGQHAPDIGPLRRFAEQAGERLLVVHDVSSAEIAAAVPGERALLPSDEDFDTEPPRRWAAVAVVMTDRGALRRTVSTLSRLGRTKSMLIWLTEAPEPVLLTRRPEWPAIASSTARTVAAGGAMTTVVFSAPVLANRVLEQLARDAVPGRDAGNGGLLVATLPGAAAPADPSTLRVAEAEDAAESGLANPPDVVLTHSGMALPTADVTGRPPLVIGQEGRPLPPVDERLLNPRGYRRGSTDEVVALVGAHGTVALRAADGSRTPPLEHGITPSTVAGLRDVRAIRIEWPELPDDDYLSAVAGLACAGVPMLAGSGPVPDVGRDRLGTRLVEVLDAPASIDTELAREERSVELRRAALREHSSGAWRARLAVAAGIPFRAYPTVSVVLATRRPEQLEFAVRQFAKQRDVDAELVLVAHGHAPDPARVRELTGGRPVTVLAVPAGIPFGEVLNRGVEAASGELVMKMDDDDWYGPDFVGDLLLARRYSGADIVGTTVEYVYLEMLDRTLRRTDDCERFVTFVAGGSIVVDRGLLRAMGGFRQARKHVDASLLFSVDAAGGSIYRSHGLGYVLRRSSAGHTWNPGVDYYLDEKRMGDQWEGFVPSRLLGHDERDRPRAAQVQP